MVESAQNQDAPLEVRLRESEKSAETLNADLGRLGREVEIIQFIAAEIISSLDLDHILNTILVSMERVLGFEHSMILLLDEAGENLRVVASRGFAESGIDAQVQVGQGIIGVVARRKKMMRMNNIGYQRAYVAAVKSGMQDGDSEVVEKKRLPGLENAQSQIAVPLLVNERLIGVFSVESPVANAFDELDETLLNILGNQAASAISNARLYQVAEERLLELDQANDALAQLNDSLEEKVEQRTAELSTALEQLTETQQQLVLQEKMASLGSLVAGIAHEINNPIGAVNSAVDVVQLCADRIAAVSGDEVQLEQPLRLLTDNIGAMRTASDRIIGLVQSLKNFAHLDEAEFQLADLNAGIESVLTLLRSKIQDRIEVEREFGELPLLFCTPGQLNQVFMSLLQNAVEAIEAEGVIRITTSVLDNCIHVQIADSGAGIAPEKLESLFDFGFSKDSPRVKMGAGLSTASSIVRQHGGEIRVESEVGKGSPFTVDLPLDKSAEFASRRANQPRD